jgi:hypothetical protein
MVWLFRLKYKSFEYFIKECMNGLTYKYVCELFYIQIVEVTIE